MEVGSLFYGQLDNIRFPGQIPVPENLHNQYYDYRQEYDNENRQNDIVHETQNIQVHNKFNFKIRLLD